MMTLPRRTRPEDLPDYDNPPLVEVVLGAQFVPVGGYNQIYAGDVWRLYKDRFPLVEEKESLQPYFETFGLPQTQGMALKFIQAPTHDRFFFKSQSQDELIQFQNDRLFHNWRKTPEGNYPRFETVCGSFFGELKKLSEFFLTLDKHPLQITQCEAIYVNTIQFTQSLGAVSDWLAFISDESIKFDDFRMVFTKVVRAGDQSPLGRLTCEANTIFFDDCEFPGVLLKIIMRGAPKNPTISDCIEFLCTAREEIVKFFTQITTPSAHQVWGRIK